MFYFLYWYYYDEGAKHEAVNRHYFDPYNMTVPAHDLVLYPEYSSLEPNTEYLVSPVNKPEEFNGEIKEVVSGVEQDVTFFYVPSNQVFSKADSDALEITDMDGKVRTIKPIPSEGYKFGS